jgi:hypothetical protein
MLTMYRKLKKEHQTIFTFIFKKKIDLKITLVYKSY